MKAFHRLHALRLANDEKRAEMDSMAPRFARLRDRHTNGTAPRAVSAFQLFQTPAPLAARMVALASPAPGLSWLEPSAGLGRILRPILETHPTAVSAVETAPDLAAELFTAFPQVRLMQGDFLARQFGRFDRIVMNPPFHMRADIQHVRHALQHLAPGGVLVGLCLSTHHRESALRPLADHWETIPAGTFRAEGTNVETILFRISKNLA